MRLERNGYLTHCVFSSVHKQNWNKNTNQKQQKYFKSKQSHFAHSSMFWQISLNCQNKTSMINCQHEITFLVLLFRHFRVIYFVSICQPPIMLLLLKLFCIFSSKSVIFDVITLTLPFIQCRCTTFHLCNVPT